MIAPGALMIQYNSPPAERKTIATAPLQGDVAWSKKVTKRRRRSAVKDQKALAITRVFTPLAVPAANGPLVANQTSPIPRPTPANDDHKAPRKVAKKSATAAKIHAYEHTTDLGKLTAAYRALEATGAGAAFTLNCSPDEIAAAQRHPKGFADYFKRRISSALKRALGYIPLFGFVVDVARDGRLHIHGAIAANDNQLDLINGALCHAGGVWESKRGREYQCKITPMYTPDIWANYCLRNQARVKRLIRGRAISITTPLRRRAKELWSVLRAAAPPSLPALAREAFSSLGSRGLMVSCLRRTTDRPRGLARVITRPVEAFSSPGSGDWPTTTLRRTTDRPRGLAVVRDRAQAKARRSAHPGAENRQSRLSHSNYRANQTTRGDFARAGTRTKLAITMM